MYFSSQIDLIIRASLDKFQLIFILAYFLDILAKGIFFKIFWHYD